MMKRVLVGWMQQGVRFWVFAGAALFLLSGVAVELDADCNSYYNSRPYYTSGGTYCAMTGGYCTECVDDEGNSCATDGASCQPRQQYYF